MVRLGFDAGPMAEEEKHVNKLLGGSAEIREQPALLAPPAPPLPLRGPDGFNG